MKIIKPAPLGILTRPYRAHGREHLGIAIPVMATLGATPRIVSESELWNMVGEELAGYTLDAALPKPHAEFLVSANAYGEYCNRSDHGKHSNDGKDSNPSNHANTCHVGIRFAGVEKRLRVSGERHWQGDSATAAEPFESLRIDWPHAYGGAGYADNPVGRGFSGAIGDHRDTPTPLPNIEYAAHALMQRGQHTAPAAFTPIAPSWPQRSALFGRLDEAWHEQDRPGFPRTMDRRYFNVAPLDQQLPSHTALPDGAAYEITRLHPERETIAGVLPGLRARSFIQRRQSNLLTEIAMRLTTAWFIPHRERVVMIFHGAAQIETFDAHDVACLLIAAEASQQVRSAEHYQRVFELRMDRQYGALHALRDSDLMPASTCDDDSTPDDPSQGAWQRNLLNRARTLADEAALSAQHANLQFPADAFADALTPAHPPQPGDLAEFVQLQEQLASEQRAALDQARKRIEHDHAAHCPPATPRRGPPTLPHDDTPPLHAGQAGMAEMAREATLKLRQAYRHTAHYQEAAPRLGANTAAADAIRERVTALHAAGESLTGLDLTGADLSGLSLRGALLAGALLENADLSDADLTGATLSEAVLVRTTLTGATLRGANLSRANLSLAHCDDTDFSESTLDGALFERTQFHQCTLRRASVERARFSQCRFDSVDFSEATLSDLAFVEQAFQHVDFSRARIRKLALIQCMANHVSFAEADIQGMACIETSAAGIRFDRATLRQACFVKDSVLDRADFSHATLSEVNLRQASAKGANFSHARIDGSDFSDACLHGANLQGARVENGYMVRTDLRDARLASVDLIGGYLRGADLRGASLHEANLFRANLAEVLLDDVSRCGERGQFDGAYLEQAVFHPLADRA
ncbi:DUF2169 domain-containing protein [Paraburkholderia bryophila]|uniref:DUF2169 family type VI secretion system accessory protein n=1 Tax=Paraburkholderia bryophila TaxID=420952 RepID=UPI00234B3BBA|nr:DUF2169 domain-containing protein [Paraburkholderia bryophila]WCM19372.1 DUF2169 domain-containing protein [Paraburkholderia bryophila]